MFVSDQKLRRNITSDDSNTKTATKLSSDEFQQNTRN